MVGYYLAQRELFSTTLIPLVRGKRIAIWFLRLKIEWWSIQLRNYYYIRSQEFYRGSITEEEQDLRCCWLEYDFTI